MKEKEEKESSGRCDNLSTDKRWSSLMTSQMSQLGFSSLFDEENGRQEQSHDNCQNEQMKEEEEKESSGRCDKRGRPGGRSVLSATGKPPALS